MDKRSKKNFFLHISFGLGVYIVHAKNGIFAIFFALAVPKNVIISDISGQTLVKTILNGSFRKVLILEASFGTFSTM